MKIFIFWVASALYHRESFVVVCLGAVTRCILVAAVFEDQQGNVIRKIFNGNQYAIQYIELKKKEKIEI